MHWRLNISRRGVSAMLLACPLATGSGQASTTIGDHVSCRSCRIVFDRVATLEVGGRAPEILQAPTSITSDSRGRILVGYDSGEYVTLYDSTGKFLQNVGRRGSGPGEFRAAHIVVFAPTDTAYIFDRRNARVTVLTPEMALARSAPMPTGIFSGAVTRDRTLVVSTEIRDASRVGKALHTFDLMGNQLRSFGDMNKSVIRGVSAPIVQWLRSAREGGFWSVSYLGGYVIARWSREGEMLQRIVRESSVLPTNDEPRIGFTRDRPPDPYVRSFAEDPAGRIWVEISVPDPNWRRGLKWSPNAVGEMALVPEITDYDAVYDTVIEVIDPGSRSLLVSQRFDQRWGHFAAWNRMSRPILMKDGSIRVEIFSPRLLGAIAP